MRENETAMHSLWQRLREAFEDNMRQQVTWLGFVFTLTVILIGLAAFASGNNLLFLLLAALLATLLISGFVSRLGLAGLELDLIVPPHIAAQRPVTARLVVRNRKWLAPSFSLHLTGSPGSGLRQEMYVPLIPAGAVMNEPVELFFARRGVYKDNTFSFASRFPFGFTHRRAHVRLEREVLVYPAVDPQPGFEALLGGIADEIESRQRGRGSDFYRIRPYEALESARHVDWRATAHTGDLQVREFAREQDHAITLFLDLDVPSDANEYFENAIHCCAFLLWRLNDKGSRLRLLTQRFEGCVPDDATVYDVLRYLARVEPGRGGTPSLPPGGDLQVAFSAHGARVRESGWPSARIFGPDELSAPAAVKDSNPKHVLSKQPAR
jgi:uncharacterized protein (DUF58 family)